MEYIKKLNKRIPYVVCCIQVFLNYKVKTMKNPIFYGF